jgi:hypothetical protein
VSTTVPKEELRALFAAMTGLPPDVVIWDGEPVPPVVFEQDARLVTLNVVSRRAIGRDETTRSYPDAGTVRFTYKGQRLLVLSVRAENFGNEEGFDLLEDVRTQLEQGDIGEMLNASNLALNEAGEVRNLDGVVDNRSISVAQLDVRLNQTVTRVVDKADPAGWIESIEMTGDPELTRAGHDHREGPRGFLAFGVKQLAAVLILAVALIAACAPSPARPSACTKTVRRIMHADTAFTPAERTEIVAAADDWLGFSGGRVHQTIAFDVDWSSTTSVASHGQEAMMMRALDWMPMVDALDQRTTAWRKAGKKIRVYGWTEQAPVRIFLVVDRFENLREVATHELGHAAGLLWPDCNPLEVDCDHARSKDSIMSPAILKSVHAFNEADLDFCRASCLCP